jgi:hypothetical protein
MNIAVLIYGRLNKCVEHYDNIIHALGMNNNIDFFLSSDNSPLHLLHDFLHLYKPISFNNDPILFHYDLGNFPGKRGETNIHNMTCHFINKNRVFSLLQEYINQTDNIHYHSVVSLRIDAVFINHFDFSNLLHNTIYIPSNFDFIHNAINDQIAYGLFDVMKIYNSIDPLFLLNNKLSIPHPESLNFANLHFHKLNIIRTDLNYFLDR